MENWLKGLGSALLCSRPLVLITGNYNCPLRHRVRQQLPLLHMRPSLLPAGSHSGVRGASVVHLPRSRALHHRRERLTAGRLHLPQPALVLLSVFWPGHQWPVASHGGRQLSRHVLVLAGQQGAQRPHRAREGCPLPLPTVPQGSASFNVHQCLVSITLC